MGIMGISVFDTTAWKQEVDIQTASTEELASWHSHLPTHSLSKTEITKTPTRYSIHFGSIFF